MGTCNNAAYGIIRIGGSQAMTARAFYALIKDFVDYRISAEFLETHYIELFHSMRIYKGEELEKIVNAFFLDVDEYWQECTPDTETSFMISEPTLRLRAMETLEKLEKYLEDDSHVLWFLATPEDQMTWLQNILNQRAVWCFGETSTSSDTPLRIKRLSTLQALIHEQKEQKVPCVQLYLGHSSLSKPIVNRWNRLNPVRSLAVYLRLSLVSKSGVLTEGCLGIEKPSVYQREGLDEKRLEQWFEELRQMWSQQMVPTWRVAWIEEDVAGRRTEHPQKCLLTQAALEWVHQGGDIIVKPFTERSGYGITRVDLR